MATGRLAHNEQFPSPRAAGIPPAPLTTAKAIVEPGFGHIMTCQNGRELSLRGERGPRGEWRLLAACHNLRKIFRHARIVRLAAARAS